MGWVDTAVETGTEVAGTLWETGWGNILGFLEQYAPEFVGPATFIKETIEGAFETIGTIIDDAKQIIGFGIDAIVSLFTGAKLEFPSIKLPHFSISGSFSLNPPSIPTIGVSWYAKGGIATAPSLVGVGEAGNEAIVPLSGSYMRPFAEAIAESMGGNGGNTIYIDGATYNDTDGINEAIGNFLMRLNRLGVI